MGFASLPSKTPLRRSPKQSRSRFRSPTRRIKIEGWRTDDDQPDDPLWLPVQDRCRMSDDQSIRDVVARLSRHHESGGTVIERAAIVAEGADSQTIVAWIVAHDGQPEFLASAPARGGLHGGRLSADGVGTAPRRYVLPPGVLS